jgi:hypothetical protein
MHTEYWSANLHGRHYLTGLYVEALIILKWVFEKRGLTMWTTFMRLKYVTTVSSCEKSNGHSGSINDA